VEWTQSHPLPKNRMDDIAQLIEKNFSKEQLAKLSEGRPIAGARGEGRPTAAREREKW
jgi:hypothetical protein